MTDQERDLTCLLGMQAGDTRALAELYDRHAALLYPVCHRILRAEADAEDALQDAWLQVWRRSAVYDARRGTVAAWLLAVARSRALERRRGLAARGRAEHAADAEPVTPPAEPPAGAAPGQPDVSARDALAQLEPQQRQALELAYFRGLSPGEIAARLGVPPATVRSVTRQGLIHLRGGPPREEWP
ncbi:MAG: sigma-70 family RNA polymerase sigma factor [Candidatus Eisenbacteria bacterium]|nr:sigma-70 family RNA polymerase sigma factor [Candidatus Eisenbacteria bacterium]